MSLTTPPETVTISDRFRGPPRSGNGGFTGGTLARLLDTPADRPAEVTLRSPVPLARELAVHRRDDGSMTVTDDERLIAEVRSSGLDLEVPPPPSWQQALEAQPDSISLQDREGSPFPGRGFHPVCFCCGADHEDGLAVYASRIDDKQVAAAWRTRPEWADKDGNIPVPWLWTALDCPGQVAFAVQGIWTGLLGRITAAVDGSARAGDNYIVTAWPVTVEGKKHFAGTAVFSESGELVARAVSVWIGRRN